VSRRRYTESPHLNDTSSNSSSTTTPMRRVCSSDRGNHDISPVFGSIWPACTAHRHRAGTDRGRYYSFDGQTCTQPPGPHNLLDTTLPTPRRECWPGWTRLAHAGIVEDRLLPPDGISHFSPYRRPIDIAARALFPDSGAHGVNWCCPHEHNTSAASPCAGRPVPATSGTVIGRVAAAGACTTSTPPAAALLDYERRYGTT